MRIIFCCESLIYRSIVSRLPVKCFGKFSAPSAALLTFRPASQSMEFRQLYLWVLSSALGSAAPARTLRLRWMRREKYQVIFVERMRKKLHPISIRSWASNTEFYFFRMMGVYNSVWCGAVLRFLVCMVVINACH